MIKVRDPDRNQRRRIRYAVHSHGLDRRKVYCIDSIWGYLCTLEKFTSECSGCSCDCGGDIPCSHESSGCSECVYTGKRVTLFACPVTFLHKQIIMKKQLSEPYRSILGY